MKFLKSANFGELFAVTFTVAATFQIALGLLSFAMAFLSPGLFRTSAGPSVTPGQAIGVALFILVVMLGMNAGISAGGAGLWLIVRKLPFIAKREA